MSELRILDHKLYNVKDRVYFLLNSIDYPTGFLICYGEIQLKNSENLSIVYSIKLLKIFEDKTTILKKFNMKRFRVFNTSTKKFKQLSVNVVQNIDDIDFDEKVQMKTDKYLFNVQSFMLSHELAYMKDLKTRSENIAKDYLTDLMNNL
jgi:hypothetical protein